jgi:hypothetical protein
MCDTSRRQNRRGLLYHQSFGGLKSITLFLRIGICILGSQMSRNQRLIRLTRYRQLRWTSGSQTVGKLLLLLLLLLLKLLQLLLLLQGRRRRGRSGYPAHMLFGRETDHVQIVGPRLAPSLVTNAACW